MLVAKVIQRIANLSSFTNQEEYMHPLNTLIGNSTVTSNSYHLDSNMDNMRKFINEISVRFPKILFLTFPRKFHSMHPQKFDPTFMLKKN
jgi:hypothetical protein